MFALFFLTLAPPELEPVVLDPPRQEETVNEDGSLSLNDIFGDAEEHEEHAETVSAPAPKKALSKWDRFDARLRVISSIYVDVDGPAPTPRAQRFSADFDGRGGFSRHETRLEFWTKYTPNEHIAIVADLETVFLKFPDPQTIEGLTDRFQLAPFHVESDAAYVHVVNLLPGLDLKFGRQTVVWGTADKFNPTNNINADDLEDRPLFTEPIANQMAVVEYHPLDDNLWFQGVWVPWFVPALLPPSATTAALDTQTDAPYAYQNDRDALDFLQQFVLANDQFDPRVYPTVGLPSPSMRNSQAAFKIGSTLGPVDMSASYYYGFHDIPMPVEARTTQLANTMDDPDPETGRWFRTDARLIYPRMHVAGLDFATQLSFLGNTGLWGEAAVIIPGRQYELVTETPIALNIPDYGPEGQLDTEVRGPTVTGKNGKPLPFLKATVGADYTIGKHVYVQAQYVRGMIDQFGGGENMGNFLVAGSELVFFGRHLVLRTFGIVEFPEFDEDDVPSAAISPNLILVPPWGFATFELGGFALIGRRDTYFGAPYTGSSIAFFKVSGQF